MTADIVTIHGLDQQLLHGMLEQLGRMWCVPAAPGQWYNLGAAPLLPALSIGHSVKYHRKRGVS